MIYMQKMTILAFIPVKPSKTWILRQTEYRMFKNTIESIEKNVPCRTIVYARWLFPGSKTITPWTYVHEPTSQTTYVHAFAPKVDFIMDK